MRRKSSITSLSWIPSEAIEGGMRVALDVGAAHYDPPPPDAIAGVRGLEALRKEDRFRFANRLSAWIEVDKPGKITDFGYDGGGHMGSTTMKIGRMSRTSEAIAPPDIQRNPARRPRLCAFSRPAADGGAFRPRAACVASRSSSGRRRWFGPRSA